MIRMNKLLKRATALSLLSLLVSCGGTTNNDQGASFLAFGYFQDESGEVGKTGESAFLFADTAPGGFDGLLTVAYLGMQNNLTKQFIRLVSIDCDYEVPGSFISIPSDSFPGSAVIGPATSGTTNSGTTTPATNTVGDAGNIFYFGFYVLSPDIYAFINNNKASFPELPFRMNATCSATGVTQAGDVITTNSLHYLIQFIEQAEVGAGNGPGVGVGTGGDLVTSGSTSALIPNTNNVSTNSEDTATAIDQEIVTVNEDGSITTTNVSGISVTSTDSVN